MRSERLQGRRLLLRRSHISGTAQAEARGRPPRPRLPPYGRTFEAIYVSLLHNSTQRLISLLQRGYYRQGTIGRGQSCWYLTSRLGPHRRHLKIRPTSRFLQLILDKAGF